MNQSPHEEHQALSMALAEPLRDGLLQRLREPDWYLTGVQVGLESLNAFQEITGLVYKDADTRTDAGRTVHRLKLVYEQLATFAKGDTRPQARVEIMLSIRETLEFLLLDLETTEKSETGGGKKRRRKRFVAQLAADINVGFMRLRTLERMKAELLELEQLKYRLFSGARKKRIAEFNAQYGAYAPALGFEDLAVLETQAGAADVIRRANREGDVINRRLTLIRDTIYAGRLRDLRTHDTRADLEEGKLLPALSRTLRAGFEYLTRAHTIYDHALDLVGGSKDELKRLAELGLAIEDDRMRAS